MGRGSKRHHARRHPRRHNPGVLRIDATPQLDATAQLDLTGQPGALHAIEIPGLVLIFRTFAGLGLMGFGGVLPLAHRVLVDERRWLTQEGFTELLGLCQFLPGGNIINLSVAIGLRFRGPLGALAALLGLISTPFVLLICLGLFYGRFSEDPVLRHGFAGLGAAASGLLVAMATRIVLPLRRRPLAATLAVVCFAAVALLRLPLLPTLVVLLPVSTAILAWRAR